ncbi:MAG: DUF58 domain-containing protein [Gammaproteobacteria bacterium]|nr:DUF58 domain-containing protein [Gammaproteobacteria bacterium]
MRLGPVLAVPRQWLRSSAAAWAQKRQGPDALSVTLDKRRIYILPSRFGLAFGFTVFAMLLGALNYGSSLGFALTFLLSGLGIVIMRHCHYNLRGVRIRFLAAQPVFASEPAEFRFALSNDASAPRYEILLTHNGKESKPEDIPAGQTRVFTFAVPTRERGLLKLGRYQVTTRFPGNLFRAWSWLHMDASCVVYPHPAPRGRPLPNEAGGEGLHGGLERGDADFIGLATAAPGEPPRRIAWKAFARSDELMVKQFAAGEQQARILTWDSLPGLDTEQRLSQLTRWCLEAGERDMAIGLQLPNRAVPVGRGQKHLNECLRALALYEEPLR